MNFHSCIVDQDIQAVEAFYRLLDEACHLLILRHIRLYHQGFAVVLLDTLPYVLRFVERMGIIHDNDRSFARKLQGNGATDAAIGPSNNGDFLIELSHISILSFLKNVAFLLRGCFYPVAQLPDGSIRLWNNQGYRGKRCSSSKETPGAECLVFCLLIKEQSDSLREIECHFCCQG